MWSVAEISFVYVFSWRWIHASLVLAVVLFHRNIDSGHAAFEIAIVISVVQTHFERGFEWIEFLSYTHWATSLEIALQIASNMTQSLVLMTKFQWNTWMFCRCSGCEYLLWGTVTTSVCFIKLFKF